MQNGFSNSKGNIVIKRAFNTKALSNFYCGIKIMDDFIHSDLENAITVNQDLFIVFENESPIGMFCLADSSFHISEKAKENIIKNLKPSPKPDLDEDSTFWFLPTHPSVEITYFAIREDKRGKGYGRWIIEEIIEMLSLSSRYLQPIVSVRALQTEDGSYSAVDFYNKCEFALAEELVPQKNIFMYRIVPGKGMNYLKR